MHDPTLRKLLSALAHGSIFFSAALISFAVPLVIMLLTEDQVVKGNAREALNFNLIMTIAWAVTWALTFLCVGFVIVPFLALFNLILPILAIVAVLSHADQVYTYPAVPRLL